MKLQAVNLNLLVSLDAILTTRSVTTAARQAGVTQPTMSYHLRQLRLLFDDPLLVRTGSGLAPTPLAEQLASRLHGTLQSLQEVLDTRMPFDPSTSQRVFRIAASDAWQLVATPPLLEAVREQAPGIQMSLKPITERSVVSMNNGTLDLVIGSHGQSPGPHACVQEITSEHYVCVARRGHPGLTSGLDLDTWCAWPHAVVATDELPGFIDQVLEKHDRSRYTIVRTPTFAALGQIVAASDLLGAVPSRVAAVWAGQLAIDVYPAPVKMPSFSVCMFWHQRFDADAAVSWLRGLVLAAQ